MDEFRVPSNDGIKHIPAWELDKFLEENFSN